MVATPTPAMQAICLGPRGAISCGWLSMSGCLGKCLLRAFWLCVDSNSCSVMLYQRVDNPPIGISAPALEQDSPARVGSQGVEGLPRTSSRIAAATRQKNSGHQARFFTLALSFPSWRSRALASFLPMPRRAASAAICSFRGREVPRAQL